MSASERDLRKMEWLFHVDLAIDKHSSKDELAKSARIAYEMIKERGFLGKGYMLVCCVVREPEA